MIFDPNLELAYKGTPNCCAGIGAIEGISYYMGTIWNANRQARWKAANRRCNQGEGTNNER